MTQLADTLGVEGVFLYTPTALIMSITDHEGEKTFLRRVNSGAVDVDKLIRFDETLELVEAKQLNLDEASRRLKEIESAAPPYPKWLTILACAVSCGAVAVFFRASMIEVTAATFLGLLLALLEWMTSRLRWEPGLLEPVSGFLAALGALLIAHFVTPIDDRLVTLAAVIVLVPGLSITIAITELAVGHLSAGVARMAGASVSLLTLTVGVALGWRAIGHLRQLPAEPLEPLGGEIGLWIAILIAPLTFAIIFRARWPQWPVIVAVAVAGFVASLFAGEALGNEFGAFCGALVVGTGSNLYARLRDRPALVPFTPGIIVLVPGSLGYRSLTAFLDHETLVGVDFAFSMVVVAVALVGGILTANILLPPKRIL